MLFLRRLFLSAFAAERALEAARAMIGDKEAEQPNRDQRVGERWYEVIGREVALDGQLMTWP